MLEVESEVAATAEVGAPVTTGHEEVDSQEDEGESPLEQPGTLNPNFQLAVELMSVNEMCVECALCLGC